MRANYQQLYRYLTEKVDDTIKLLDMVSAEGNSPELVTSLIRGSLVSALRGAEHMYQDQTRGE